MSAPVSAPRRHLVHVAVKLLREFDQCFLAL
jgi:hypothetical protein